MAKGKLVVSQGKEEEESREEKVEEGEETR